MTSKALESIFGNIILIAYFISLIIAMLNYRKYFDTVLKYFPVIIAYTFFNELLGYVIRYSDSFAFFADNTFANDIIYNVYDLFYYGFFYWVFWGLVTNPKKKHVIKILAFSVLGIYIINSFFQDPMTISLYYATSLASLILAFFVLLYWKSKTEWNWSLEKNNLMFWVSLGLFIFHILFPVLFLTGYLKSEIWYEYNFQSILRVIIVIMYSLFCVGFIISRRRAFR